MVTPTAILNVKNSRLRLMVEVPLEGEAIIHTQQRNPDGGYENIDHEEVDPSILAETLMTWFDVDAEELKKLPRVH